VLISTRTADEQERTVGPHVRRSSRREPPLTSTSSDPPQNHSASVPGETALSPIRCRGMSAPQRHVLAVTNGSGRCVLAGQARTVTVHDGDGRNWRQLRKVVAGEVCAALSAGMTPASSGSFEPRCLPPAESARVKRDLSVVPRVARKRGGSFAQDLATTV
jgi:hypothetical protein